MDVKKYTSLPFSVSEIIDLSFCLKKSTHCFHCLEEEIKNEHIDFETPIYRHIFYNLH